jgi:hypothetical protein
MSESAQSVAPTRKPDGRSVQKEKFIRLFARTGAAAYAAEKAGYLDAKSAATRLRSDPKVVKAVLEVRQAFISMDLGGLAYAELKHLIADRDHTPPSVRFAACKWVLEAAGHGPGGDGVGLPDQGKALADMSLGELAAFIAHGDKVLAGLTNATIQGTAERVDMQTGHATEGVTALELADLLG